MPVDSEGKRRSVLGMVVLPVADASIDQGDRQHVVGLYSGVLAGGGGTPDDVSRGMGRGIMRGISSGVD